MFFIPLSIYSPQSNHPSHAFLYHLHTQYFLFPKCPKVPLLSPSLSASAFASSPFQAMEALKLSLKAYVLLLVVAIIGSVSAQEVDVAPAPAPSMTSGADLAMPVLGAVLLASLMSFLAHFTH
ncbi:hypothetical protein ACLOJK_008501 [Asimina triloba]